MLTIKEFLDGTENLKNMLVVIEGVGYPRRVSLNLDKVDVVQVHSNSCHENDRTTLNQFFEMLNPIPESDQLEVYDPKNEWFRRIVGYRLSEGMVVLEIEQQDANT